MQVSVWNVLHAARWKYRTQKWRKKSPSRPQCTTLSGCIFVTKASIDNRKKLLSSNTSSTRPRNMAKFGSLTAEIGSGVWASARLCGVEQRAPPIFDRAAITLGSGPHSSWVLKCNYDYSYNLKKIHIYSASQYSHCKRCISYGNSVCLFVRPSVCLSVTRRYCVKTTARSTVQFALLDSKMCLVL